MLPKMPEAYEMPVANLLAHRSQGKPRCLSVGQLLIRIPDSYLNPSKHIRYTDLSSAGHRTRDVPDESHENGDHMGL